MSSYRSASTAEHEFVYFGHDLHFRRLRQQAGVIHDERILRAADRIQQRECAIWQQVDLSLYPSEEEADMATALHPACAFRSIVPYWFESFASPRSAPAGLEIIFVAGFSHTPNEDAACWFATEIMPLVRRKVPGAHLSIVGSFPTAAVRALAWDDASAGSVGSGAVAGNDDRGYGPAGNGNPANHFIADDNAERHAGSAVTVFGNVSDAELSAAYARARVAVVPLRCGAGVKLKVAEALREGVPLVTTPVGAQGLPGIWQVVAVAEDPEPFAAAVVALLLDDVSWARSCSAQLAFARSRFSGDAMQITLLDALRIKQPPPQLPAFPRSEAQHQEACGQAA